MPPEQFLAQVHARLPVIGGIVIGPIGDELEGPPRQAKCRHTRAMANSISTRSTPVPAASHRGCRSCRRCRTARRDRPDSRRRLLLLVHQRRHARRQRHGRHVALDDGCHFQQAVVARIDLAGRAELMSARGRWVRMAWVACRAALTLPTPQ
jgi:hypothetical protein